MVLSKWWLVTRSGKCDDETNPRFLDLFDDIFRLQIRISHLSSELNIGRGKARLAPYATSFTKSASRSPIMIDVKLVFA